MYINGNKFSCSSLEEVYIYIYIRICCTRSNVVMSPVFCEWYINCDLIKEIYKCFLQLASM